MLTMNERLHMEAGDMDEELRLTIEDFEESYSGSMDEDMDMLDENEGFGLRIHRGIDMFDPEYFDD